MDSKGEKHYTREEALEKLRKFCDYQDRCQKDVWDKLMELGIHPDIANEIIVTLIEEQFIDEERFAIAYVRGKFKHNHWGRQKIEQGLKTKNIHPNLINLALQEIDDHQYREQLRSLLHKKRPQIKPKNQYDLKSKMARFLIGKGYESNLVWEMINEELQRD